MHLGPHPSHVTRFSDASTFDEICVNCGATDEVPGGWGQLAYPCPHPPVATPSALAERDDSQQLDETEHEHRRPEREGRLGRVVDGEGDRDDHQDEEDR
jgi:hypothetical protein